MDGNHTSETGLMDSAAEPVGDVAALELEIEVAMAGRQRAEADVARAVQPETIPASSSLQCCQSRVYGRFAGCSLCYGTVRVCLQVQWAYIRLHVVTAIPSEDLTEDFKNRWHVFKVEDCWRVLAIRCITNSGLSLALLGSKFSSDTEIPECTSMPLSYSRSTDQSCNVELLPSHARSLCRLLMPSVRLQFGPDTISRPISPFDTIFGL
eukprot:Gb_23378 [translate_table: standard]